MFLPLKISLLQLALLAVVGYYLISYLALRRKLMRAGPWLLTIPILAIAAIIMSDEPNFGLRVMGGGREGGSGSLFIIVAAAAYVCGISVASPSAGLLARIPLISVIAAGVFAIPYVVTTYIPATAPYFFLVFESINTSAYYADVLNSGEIVREGTQAALGLVILTCLMAYYPVTTWWRPKRVWMGPVAAGCIALAILGGYRTVLVDYTIEIVLLAWCYITWRSLLFIPVLVLGCILLVTAHSSHVIDLPLSAQRTLAFLPGDWDPDVVGNTEASNDFRSNIIDVYLKEYASAHPWLGNGISYDADDFNTFGTLQTTQPMLSSYWLSKQFIAAKMFHTGWISVYDAIGLIGSFFFVLGFCVLSFLTGRLVLAPGVNRKSPLFPVKAWLFAFTVTKFVTFFVTYGDLKATFPIFCSVCVAYYHINRVETLGPERISHRELRFDPQRSGLPVPA